MSKYYAYIRVSTDKQTLENQKHKILEFAFNKKIQIEDFIEVEVSSRKNQKERLIEDLFLKLKENDTLVVTELSRLGRNMLEILNLIEKFNSKNIKLIFINQPEYKLGLSVQKIVKYIGVGTQPSLRSWIRSRI